MGRLRILLVDDHALLRTALRAILNEQPDMEVVGEAKDGEEAVKEAEQLLPEVILLDVSMPGMSGVEAARHLKQVSPASRLLALSAYEDERSMHQMLSAGADGYAPKSSSPEELLLAIRRVASGERSGDAVQARGSGEARPPPSPAAGEAPALTPEEVEVLRRFAQGYPLAQIASALGLDLATLEQHKERGLRKLGLKTRADVARVAAERGWK